jgi:hypothetical protein
MNSEEKFQLELEDYAELLDPTIGRGILLTHFIGMFPCRFWLGTSRTREGLVKHSWEFLDRLYTPEQMKSNYHLAMWHIDQNLRQIHSSEEEAVRKIDEALIKAHEKGERRKSDYTDNPKDYDLLFEVTAPVYRILRGMKRFTFEDLFNG